MQNLLWTEKELSDGSVDIKGIPGDPATWVNQSVKYFSISYYADDFSRMTSHRVAMGFNYNLRRIYFSDRGFKELSWILLADTTQIPYTYNLTMQTVYSGISTQVRH